MGDSWTSDRTRPTRLAIPVAIAAWLAVALLFPGIARAISVAVRPDVVSAADVGASLASVDQGGLGLLLVDGEIVRSAVLTPTVPATFAAVPLAPGLHELRIVVRSSAGLAFSPAATVHAWGTPAPPRSQAAVSPGLCPRSLVLPVSVGANTTKVTGLVNGKAVLTKTASPGSRLSLTLPLPPGNDMIELRSENPVAHASTKRPLVRPVWPVLGPTEVGSKFGMRDGRMHKGIDIHAPGGAPVVAAGPGVVIWAENLTTYGGLVMIDHGRHMVTYYAHLSRIDCRIGQKVTMGQRVGAVGNTGNASGGATHLHFQLFVTALGAADMPDKYRRVNSGTPVDPLLYVSP